jgi:hypothetical protein
VTPSLSYGQICPCGIGTVTGVMDGFVHAKSESFAFGAIIYQQHRHTFAEVAAMLRKAKWREVDRKHWPHECVRCGAPAFVGVTPASLDCSDGCR